MSEHHKNLQNRVSMKKYQPVVYMSKACSRAINIHSPTFFPEITPVNSFVLKYFFRQG